MKEKVMQAIYKGLIIFLDSFFRTAARKGLAILTLVGVIMALGFAVGRLWVIIEDQENRWEHKITLIQSQWRDALNTCNRERELLGIKVALMRKEVENLKSKK